MFAYAVGNFTSLKKYIVYERIALRFVYSVLINSKNVFSRTSGILKCLYLVVSSSQNYPMLSFPYALL